MALDSLDCGRPPTDKKEARRPMTADNRKILRCAIYTRKSTEHGLEQEFNSLDAQREACDAYIKSQASLGGKVKRTMTLDDLGGATPANRCPAVYSKTKISA